MSIPNLTYVVQQCREEFPEAWANAHTGNAHTEDFIRICAKRMHAINSKFGLNGKRGNPLDISDDAVNFIGEGPGTTPGGQPCTVIDIIASAGSKDAKPYWGAMSDPVASSGAWVNPNSAPGLPTPQPPLYPPYPPNESDVDGAGVALFADFGLALQAPNPAMFRFAFRVAYSWLTKEVPDLPASVAKHRAEWRALLGLPPL